MIASTAKAIQQFEQRLSQSQNDFIISPHTHEAFNRFSFIGHFLGKRVIWNAHLKTLHSIAKHESAQKQQQFIHIQHQENTYQLTIGLYLDTVNLASIRCAIIMIRNYKNLHLGLHKYGPIYFF